MKVTGNVFGHPVYSYGGSDVRWEDNDELVPKNGEFASQPDANHPCPKCHKLPGPSGHDPCIDQLEGVEFACCGHGVEKPYVAFDEDEMGNRRVIRGEEAEEYFRLVK